MRAEHSQTSEFGDTEILKFHIGTQPYAIDVQLIQEILQITRISNVPNTNKMISGLALVRGEVVSVIDLRYVLENCITMNYESQMSLLCEVKGQKIAFLVDEVIGIHRMHSNQIMPPEPILNSEIISANLNLDNTIVLMLDLGKIVSNCMNC